MSEFGPIVNADYVIGKTQEVKDKKEELKEPLEAEQKTYEYFANREELLTIFDEVKELYCYEDFLNSDFAQNFQFKPELKEAIDALFKEDKDRDRSKAEIMRSLADLFTENERKEARDKKERPPEDILYNKYLKLNIQKNNGEITPEQMKEQLLATYPEETVNQLYNAVERLNKLGNVLSDEDMVEALKEAGFNEEEISTHLLFANCKKHLESYTEAETSAARSASAKGEKYEPKEKHPMLFADFLTIYEKIRNDVKLYNDFFYGPLLDNIYEKISSTFTSKHTGSISEEDQEKFVEARTIGQHLKIGYLMKCRFSYIIDRLAKFNDSDLHNMVRTYGISKMPEVRKKIKDLKQAKTGVQIGQISKEQAVTREAEGMATYYGAKVEDAKFVQEAAQILYAKKFHKKITVGVESIIDEQGNLVNKEFLPAYINFRQELQRLYNMLHEGMVVETDAVKEIMAQMDRYTTKNPPTVVYLHGDYGTGKTAIAKHYCAKRMGKVPIVVSGSKFLEPDRLTEEFQISKQEMAKMFNDIRAKAGKEAIYNENSSNEEMLSGVVGDRNELRAAIVRSRIIDAFAKANNISPEKINAEEIVQSQEFQQFKEDTKLQEQELSDIEKQLDDLYSRSVEGTYVLRGMYLAMKEGRPLIIDEANAISQEVLIAFNDLMTKKYGETVGSHSLEGDFEVKKGYCVIWTGNTGSRYIERKEIDPATFSRIAPILVEYLPQSVSVDALNELLKRVDLKSIAEEAYKDSSGAVNVEKAIRISREKAKQDQIFQVMLIKLLSSRLGAEMLCKINKSAGKPEVDRYSFVKDIYKISVGARMIMNMFEGKLDGVPDLPDLASIVESGQKEVQAKELKKSNLTIRELIDNVIGGYIDEGCAMDLEYYLYNFVQKQAMNGKEQAIIYAILQTGADLFRDEGWPKWQTIANDSSYGSWQEKLAALRSAIAKNPVQPADSTDGVKKYKRIEINGNFVSLLNLKKDEEPEYVLTYENSLETMQLVFGKLPPNQVKDYEAYSETSERLAAANMPESEKSKEEKATLIEISASIEATTGLLLKDDKWTASSSETKMGLRNSIDALGLHRSSGRTGIDLEGYFKKTATYIKILKDFYISTGQLTAEQEAEIERQETPGQKLHVLERIQTEINSKKE